MIHAALRARAQAWLSRAIADNPNCEALCRELDGRCLGIRIAGVERPLQLRVAADGTLSLPCDDATADVSIEGSLPALLAFMLGLEVQTPALKESIQVSGKVHLAQRFQDLLRELTPDWEELLANVAGDLPARRTANLARSAAAGLSEAGRTLEQNLLEYLQYEAARVPSPEEWAAFRQDLDELRTQVAAVQARLEKLAERFS